MAEACLEIKKQKPKSVPRKPWLTDDTLAIIEERKQLKKRGLETDEDRNRHRGLSTRIKGLCRSDKNRYLNGICQEIEEHAEKFETGSTGCPMT